MSWVVSATDDHTRDPLSPEEIQFTKLSARLNYISHLSKRRENIYHLEREKSNFSLTKSYTHTHTHTHTRTNKEMG